jgi:predicted RNA-binding protein associated with RNAse of E/G family
MTRQINYLYHRPGKGTIEYHEWLVADEPHVKVLLLEENHSTTLQVGQQSILEPDGPIVWFIFPNAWYEVGRFHLGDGTFTGWYTNFSTPIVMDGDTWSSTDLFLDHWLSHAGQPTWLDEDEFDDAIRTGLIDSTQVAMVMERRSFIDGQVENGAWPPGVALEWDLERARAGR